MQYVMFICTYVRVLYLWVPNTYILRMSIIISILIYIRCQVRSSSVQEYFILVFSSCEAINFY